MQKIWAFLFFSLVDPNFCSVFPLDALQLVNDFVNLVSRLFILYVPAVVSTTSTSVRFTVFSSVYILRNGFYMRFALCQEYNILINKSSPTELLITPCVSVMCAYWRFFSGVKPCTCLSWNTSCYVFRSVVRFLKITLNCKPGPFYVIPGLLHCKRVLCTLGSVIHTISENTEWCQSQGRSRSLQNSSW